MTQLSPYKKAVVAAVGGLAAVAYQIFLGEAVDAETIGAAVIALLTTLGVYQATNVQALTSDRSVPSPHEIILDEPILPSSSQQVSDIDSVSVRRQTAGNKVRAAKNGTKPKPKKRK